MGSDDFIEGILYLFFSNICCNLDVPSSRKLPHPFEVFESQIEIGLQNAFDNLVGIGPQEPYVALYLIKYVGEKPGLDLLEIRLAR
jgi:hypothetical protein